MPRTIRAQCGAMRHLRQVQPQSDLVRVLLERTKGLSQRDVEFLDAMVANAALEIRHAALAAAGATLAEGTGPRRRQSDRCNSRLAQHAVRFFEKGN